MYKIISKQVLNKNVISIEVEAPYIAKKTKPGQFVVIRIDEKGERIPFTVSGTNTDTGTVSIIFQTLGKSTLKLGSLSAGDSVLDFVGPLGNPTDLEGIKKVAVVGGGLGCAIAYPQAKYLFASGAEVDLIGGFRTKDLIILEDEMRACSNRLFICTDDGSYGEKGFVTDMLEKLIKEGAGYDCVIAVGPLIMMKMVARLTEKYGIKTIVSMNPIMIDGTGMCGCCRVTVGGKIRFACVDGPDFDGHQVDFDEAMKRLATYNNEEKTECDEYCRLQKAVPNDF
jgi:ferredoxin--NADP+ reductase